MQETTITTEQVIKELEASAELHERSMQIIEAALDADRNSDTWRAQRIADEITQMRQTLSKAKYLLVQSYLACIRPEWEEGRTIDEVTDMICSFLWNQGLQPKLAEHENAVSGLIRAHESKAV